MHYLLIALITFISTHKALGFYFWHDDFFVFYQARLNECILGFPYITFCPIFDFLYRLFGYHPRPYFALGIILAVATSFAFYSLIKQFVDKRTALLTTLIMATAYVGAGVFLEAYDPIISFPSLALFFVALGFFLKSAKKELVTKDYVLGLIFFTTSLVWFFARSLTHFIPAVALLILFWSRLPQKKLAAAIIGIFFIFFITFFAFPKFLGRGEIISHPITGLIYQIDLPREVILFLQSLSSLVWVDSLPAAGVGVRTFLGGITLLMLVYFWFRAKDKKVFKIRFLSLIWIAAMYLPYGIRSDWRLETTHRYILFTFPGLLLYWATLSWQKWWRPVTILAILIFIGSNNLFLGQHLKFAQKQREFYWQLHQMLPELSADTILFFDSPHSVRNELADFFRVGTSPPESALGTEYALDYKDLRLFLESDSLARQISDKKVDQDRLLAYYYDGGLLTDTTAKSREMLSSVTRPTQKLDLIQKTEFVFDQGRQQWSGSNPGINFHLEKGETTLPFQLSLEILAAIPKLPLPYTQACSSCEQDSLTIRKSLEYLALAKKIKKSISVQVSNAAEETTAEGLVDFDETTQWLANRQDWVQDIKPTLEVSFGEKTLINGLVLRVDPNRRKPSAIELLADGRVIDYRVEDQGSEVRVLLPTSIGASSLTLTIEKTQDGTNPAIFELEIIPSGFSEIDLSRVAAIKKSPAAWIKTPLDLTALSRYLASGVEACVKWNAPGYGEGVERFELFVDGQVHEYRINFPALGGKDPEISVNCLNFPVDISLEAIR